MYTLPMKKSTLEQYVRITNNNDLSSSYALGKCFEMFGLNFHLFPKLVCITVKAGALQGHRIHSGSRIKKQVPKTQSLA